MYYAEAAPFPIADIRRVAQQYSDGDPPIVADFYEWGPWVNGGAWIHTAVGKVDFLYRSFEHVEQTIQEAQQGIISHDYDQQPPFGFYNVIYLAETHICLPLFDPHAALARLKQAVAVYPPELQQAIVVRTLWGAEFTFLFARKFAAVGDVYNTVGCLSRLSGYLTQALYALTSSYFISNKGALETLSQCRLYPPDYSAQLSQILAHPGRTEEQLSVTVNKLHTLWQEVVNLAGALYAPRYPLRF
ncbi:MAG TPA: hypothetical protein VNN62_14720 [Methylomirabilota bacterium]|nr:hypothetical protein [Methylomirabilota bacterium]